MERFQDFARHVASGLPAGLATVVVRFPGTLTAVPLYSDTLPTPTPLANPLTAAAGTGYFGFYAANGRYDVTVTPLTTPAYTLNDILLHDPA